MNKIIFAVLFLLCSPLSNSYYYHLIIIWNVGQGQWLTYIDEAGNCHHIDAGGEFKPWLQIKALCKGRKNTIHLTHSDYDHTRFASSIKSSFINGGSSLPPEIKQWTPPDQLTMKAKNANYQSRAFVICRDFLVTGDAPKATERILATETTLSLGEIRYFVLGHHGSRTSNGDNLLKSLHQLQLGIASSRFQRFRHPHPEIQARLRKRKTPLLTTEKWGSIWIQLNPSRCKGDTPSLNHERQAHTLHDRHKR